MREIPVKQVKSLMKQLLKSKESKYVVLLTKKKDRSLTIESDGEQIKLTEQGYENSVKIHLRLLIMWQSMLLLRHLSVSFHEVIRFM